MDLEAGVNGLLDFDQVLDDVKRERDVYRRGLRDQRELDRWRTMSTAEVEEPDSGDKAEEERESEDRGVARHRGGAGTEQAGYIPLRYLKSGGLGTLPNNKGVDIITRLLPFVSL